MWNFAFDIDETLTGHAASLRRLAKWIRKERAACRLRLILVTGRPFSEVRRGWRSEGIPEADAVICQIGTEIFLPPFHPKSRQDRAWQKNIALHFNRKEARSFLENIPGLSLQKKRYNTRFKLSAHLHPDSDPEKAWREVIRRTRTAKGKYRVIWSHGHDLDVLPHSAGKGNALRYLLTKRNWDSGKVIVAGNSGNDLDLYQTRYKGIVVHNARPELLKGLKKYRGRDLFYSQKSFAAGLEEGIVHFTAGRSIRKNQEPNH